MEVGTETTSSGRSSRWNGKKEAENRVCLAHETGGIQTRRLSFEGRGGNRFAFNLSYTCVRIGSVVPALIWPALLALTTAKRNAMPPGGASLQ